MILLGLRRSATSLPTSERRYLKVLRIRPEMGYAVIVPSRVSFNTSRRGIDKNSATRSASTKGSKSSELCEAGRRLLSLRFKFGSERNWAHIWANPELDLLKPRLGKLGTTAQTCCLWHHPSPRGLTQAQVPFRPVHFVEPVLVDGAMHRPNCQGSHRAVLHKSPWLERHPPHTFN